MSYEDSDIEQRKTEGWSPREDTVGEIGLGAIELGLP